MSKSQGKGNYFMQNFGKVSVAEAVCHIHVPSATYLQVTADNSWACPKLPESTLLISLITEEGQVRSAGKLMPQEWPTIELWELIDKYPSFCTPLSGTILRYVPHSISEDPDLLAHGSAPLDTLAL